MGFESRSGDVFDLIKSDWEYLGIIQNRILAVRRSCEDFVSQRKEEKFTIVVGTKWAVT